nr:uncharacterized protein LOC109768507 [Aegilops tauschii subsp. strangulata]
MAAPGGSEKKAALGDLGTVSSPAKGVPATMPAGGSSAAQPVLVTTRRPRKEPALDAVGPAKKTLVVNISGARKAMQARFLAVGLFLSVTLVNSRQLIDHMKGVWKVRGALGELQLAAKEGRKFVLEFSEDGDRQHVIRGGPWQYHGDPFLVVGLEAGADPTSAVFSHMPMWVQFRDIPFYLLTKELARSLGEQVGKLVMIDQHSRGNICEKFLRARVQLPLYSALLKEITLEDEITGEEVPVSLRYERLPNFCLFCGFIGHMEARCDLPENEKKLRYPKDISVRAVHFDDPRAWFLPDKMGKPKIGQAASSPWRAPMPSSNSAVHCPAKSAESKAVEQVSEVVARLTVGDKMDTVPSQEDTNTITVMVAASPVVGKADASHSVEAGGLEGENHGTRARGNEMMKTAAKEVQVANKAEGIQVVDMGSKPGFDTEKKGGNKGKKEASKGNGKGSAIVGPVLGKREARTQEGSEYAGAKEDGVVSDQNKKKKEAGQADGMSNNGTDGGQEATGPGAPGLLVGATDSTRQEP